MAAIFTSARFSKGWRKYSYIISTFLHKINMNNNILDYVFTLQSLFNPFSEDVVETLSDSYDDGESHSISEAKDIMDSEIDSFIAETESALACAKEMKRDLRKLSKKKFIDKYSC